MKLIQLRKDFNSLDTDEKLEFVREYIEKRSTDIANRAVVKMKVKDSKSKGKSSKRKLVNVTDEQMDLLKELGLV